MRKVLGLFSELPESCFFYLTGGTALSDFYLHHRLSFYLDFFAPPRLKIRKSGLVLETSDKTKRLLKKSRMDVRWLQKNPQCAEMIVIKNGRQTRLTLAFDTAILLKPLRKRYLGVTVASFEDVASSKLAALQERMEHRDILDVYFILKKIKSEKLIGLARKRWDHIDPYKVAQLFSRMEMMIPPFTAFQGFLQKNARREQVARFYMQESKKILEKIAPK